MLQVNKKDIRTTSKALFIVFIVNFEHISHIKHIFEHISTVSIVNFDHVIAEWVII